MLFISTLMVDFTLWLWGGSFSNKGREASLKRLHLMNKKICFTIFLKCDRSVYMVLTWFLYFLFFYYTLYYCFIFCIFVCFLYLQNSLHIIAKSKDFAFLLFMSTFGSVIWDFEIFINTKGCTSLLNYFISVMRFLKWVIFFYLFSWFNKKCIS